MNLCKKLKVNCRTYSLYGSNIIFKGFAKKSFANIYNILIFMEEKRNNSKNLPFTSNTTPQNLLSPYFNISTLKKFQ